MNLETWRAVICLRSFCRQLQPFNYMERTAMNIVLALIGMVVNIVVFISILEEWLSKETFKNHKDRRMLRFYCTTFALYLPSVYLVGILGEHEWVPPICFAAMMVHFFSLVLPSRDELRKKIIRRLSKTEPSVRRW